MATLHKLIGRDVGLKRIKEIEAEAALRNKVANVFLRLWGYAASLDIEELLALTNAAVALFDVAEIDNPADLATGVAVFRNIDERGGERILTDVLDKFSQVEFASRMEFLMMMRRQLGEKWADLYSN